MAKKSKRSESKMKSALSSRSKSQKESSPLSMEQSFHEVQTSGSDRENS
jgi:hypothetical protein